MWQGNAGAAGVTVLTGALASVGGVLRAEGNFQVMKAFAAADAARFVWAGGVASVGGAFGGMGLGAGTMVSAGGAFVTTSSYFAVGGLGLAAAYFGESYLLCLFSQGEY